jgi:hypothetical protein
MPYDRLATSAYEASNLEVDDSFAVEALEEFLSNYPDNWRTPYNNIIEEIKDLERQLQPTETSLKVGKEIITIKDDGTMFFENGNPVTDPVIQNQANVLKEKKDGTLRVSISGGFKFFVLSDNKIILSAKNNLGKEYIADSKIMETILDKAVTYKKTC